MKNALKLLSLALCLGTLTLASCQKEEPIDNNNNNSNIDDPDPVIPDTITVNGHDAINLGLSVRWATYNVGASSSEEYGEYYAWGETETKTEYQWSNYKFGPNYYSLTKYCTKDSYGTVDNKIVLEPEDDVAHVKWGEGWRMPTADEFQELRKNCRWKLTTKNEVNGYEITGANGNSIFLPFAGYQSTSGATSVGTIGFYFSSSLNTYTPDEAFYLWGDRFSYGVSDQGYRQNGLPIRPVIAQ